MNLNGVSESHQNNNLKALTAFAHFLGSSISFLDIRQNDLIISFLDSKLKGVEDDPDRKSIVTFERIGTHYWLNENRNYSDDPDDDEEEREERRKLELELEQRRIDEMSWVPDLEKEMEETQKAQRQLDDLSNISLIKQIREIRERYDELKLGLKIAYLVSIPVSFTYKQLAFQLFPEARTKSDKELEPCIQMIARSIKAVQIQIFTRCFSTNTTIRIFPIALPSSKDGIERVFNGYERKYIDKVLSEFIVRK